MKLEAFDKFLISNPDNPSLFGFKRFLVEFLYFGIKEARACLFAGLFFILVFTFPRAGFLGIPRYDFLLLAAIGIQAWMVLTKLETIDELKAISLFHFVGFILEVYKTSAGIKSWSYPDFAYTKLLGVPLFSGFMYAAIGSYMIQAWRLFDLRVKHHPMPWMATIIAFLIYLNFFTLHYIGDFRWYLTACILGLYSRTIVTFRPYDRDRKMPLLLSFILIGFFIWIAENISTFYGVWKYPNQIGAWSSVHIGKWSSWSLLVIMTFTIVVNLKHIKKSIHTPE
jgi:uncharacterized membrane protein YoaT (DUF817 family)